MALGGGWANKSRVKWICYEMLAGSSDLEGNGLGGRELDRDRWRALVNTDMNLRAPQNAENSCASSGDISSQLITPKTTKCAF